MDAGPIRKPVAKRTHPRRSSASFNRSTRGRYKNQAGRAKVIVTSKMNTTDSTDAPRLKKRLKRQTARNSEPIQMKTRSSALEGIPCEVLRISKPHDRQSHPYPPTPVRRQNTSPWLSSGSFMESEASQVLAVGVTAIPSLTGISAFTGPLAGVGKVADQPTITGSRCVQSLRSVSSDSLSFRGPGLFSDLHKCQVCDLNGSSPRVWSERTRCALSGSVPITSYVAIFSS
jgi:hypothetical protein